MQYLAVSRGTVGNTFASHAESRVFDSNTGRSKHIHSKTAPNVNGL